MHLDDGTKYRIAQINRLRVLTCAFENHTDLLLQEDLNKLELHKNGFSKEHISGIASLKYEAVLDLCGFLRNPDFFPKIKLILSAIVRAELAEESVSEISGLLQAFPKLLPHPDRLARLMRIHAACRDATPAMLENLISRNVYVKTGKLKAYLNEDMRTYGDFNKLVDLDDSFHGISITPVSGGIEILREGQTMNHCLASTFTAYDFFSECVTDSARTFHLACTNNQVVCATLHISGGHGRSWRRITFETVGRGTPPKRFLDAAGYIVDTYNLKLNGAISPQVEDDFPEFETGFEWATID